MGPIPKDSMALREVRENRLRRTIEICLSAHPFYRNRLPEMGIGLNDIGSLDDLQRLPLIDKALYMACPEDFRLKAHDAPSLSFEESILWNIAYTTGTTSGKPSPFFNTSHDQFHIMLQARRCAMAEGIGPQDLIANLVPLSPMPTGGFLVVGRTAEAMGVPVVSTLTGASNPLYPVRRRLDEAIDCLSIANPTIFWGIPSFIRRFFRRTVARNIRFPRARMVILSGEPVSNALQNELFEHLRFFGADNPQVRVRYSFTEMQGGLVQCCNGAAVQNIVPDLYYLEVVNPETGKRLPDGVEGALAVSHLHRRGTILLRYLVGDLAALRTDHCPDCGRIGERIVLPPRRTGSLIKVKGMLINPELIFEALSANRNIREFQLIVRKSNPSDPDSMDSLVVRIEAAPEEYAALSENIPDIIRKIVMVRPLVEFAAAGEIHDPMKHVKAKRIVDERPSTK